MTYTRNFAPWCMILGLTLCAPFAAQSGSIIVNGTCDFSCAPNSLSDGTSISSPFNFDVTLTDGDEYDISGSYSASYSKAAGSTIAVNPTFTYIGSSPTTATDTINFTLAQDYFDPSCCTWAGTYFESIPLTLGATAGAGSTISGELLYDGKSVGLVGPFPPGSYTVSKSAALDFGSLDTDPTLLADFNFAAQFAPGTLPNTSASSVSTSATPEPAMDLVCGLGLILFVYVARRRNRSRIAA
jgi:hypothetical protein